MQDLGSFYDKLSNTIDSVVSGDYRDQDKEIKYLSHPAPNIIEWVTGVDYWNVPTTFGHWRQYQLLRDLFNIRCKICNPNKLEAINCWDKPRSYLESEILLTWENQHNDFVCPKCRNTMREFAADGIITLYNDFITIAGMRSGKSYLGGHIGGYEEHMSIVFGIRGGKGYLQRLLKQEKSEWFEITFAASTAAQAKETIYAKYREMRNNSPWINRYINWVKKEEEKQIGNKDKWTYSMGKESIEDGFLQMRFNKVSSDSRGIAGRTRIFASIDEWSRLMDSEGTRSAQELFRVMNQSLKTVRTAVDMNSLPPMFGLMVNVTSPIAYDDPAMLHYNKAMKGELRRTFYWKGATWEFNPFMPREAFDEEYEKDPVGAERDYAANPPNAAVPFVDDPIRFWNAIEWTRNPIAEFSETHLTDPTQEKYVGLKLDKCRLNTIDNFYIFCDAGVSFDAFAMVCAHPEWINTDNVSEENDDGSQQRRIINKSDESGRIQPVNSEGVWAGDIGTYIGDRNDISDQIINRAIRENERASRYSGATSATGTPYEHMGEMMVTVVDFCVRIIPTQTRDIWFESVVEIIKDLKQKIRIASVCFDHWNSESSIQQIRSMGIQSYKVSLNSDHFMNFLRTAYNGRVKMLPPHEEDKISISENGNLVLGKSQEFMHGESVGIIEVMKLNRSPDLKRFYNPNKGRIRGRDSDDLARCIIGVHTTVQNSIVDDMANTKKKKSIRKRQQANDNPLSGTIFRGGRSW